MKNIRIPMAIIALTLAAAGCQKTDVNELSSGEQPRIENITESSGSVSAKAASQVQTKISGKNAYVHLPADYNSSSAKYPTLIFFPGLGEAAGSASELLKYGPSKFVNDGHNMEFTVNGTREKLIVISVQPGEWAGQSTIETIINGILSNGVSGVLAANRIDLTRVYLTGLSAGGWQVQNYITGKSSNASKIAAVVVSHAVQTDNPLSQVSYFAKAGGKWWGVEGAQDMRGMDSFRDAMNNSVSGSARYTLISSGQSGSGHCCWNNFYDPNWTATGESFYTWLLKQRKGSSTPSPTPEPEPTPVQNMAPKANAGSDKYLTLPSNSVVVSGSGTDSDGSISAYRWTKISGPSQISIANTGSASTSVSNLVEGSYTLQLTVTDNKGATATDNVNITVKAATVVTTPPSSGSSTTSKVEAENYTAMKGIYVVSEGGIKWVGHVDKGDWMDYSITNATSGIKTITFRVAAPSSGRQMQILDSKGNVLSTVNLPTARWWGDWMTVNTSVNLPAGTQTIRIYASQAPFDMDWFEIK